jgi:hypothetical protein
VRQVGHLPRIRRPKFVSQFKANDTDTHKTTDGWNFEKYLAFSVESESISRPFSLCNMSTCSSHHTVLQTEHPRSVLIRHGSARLDGRGVRLFRRRVGSQKKKSVTVLTHSVGTGCFFLWVMCRGQRTDNLLSLNVELTKAFMVWHLIKHWECAFHTDHVHLFPLLVQSVGPCNVRIC